MLVKVKRYIMLFQAIIFGLMVGIYILAIDFKSSVPKYTDFYKFYMSAKFFWEKKDIYTLVPIDPPSLPNSYSDKEANTVKTLHPNLNSPFHTLCMSIFGLFDLRKAYLIWSIFSLTCALGGVALIAYNISGNGYNLLLLFNLWIILLCYYPTFININLGQFSFLLLLLIAAAWTAAKKGRDRAAGIILGLTMALKLFLGIFLIFFAVYRRWRLLFWFLCTFLICNVLSFLIFGIPTYKKFLSLLNDMPWYAGSWNASFTGFFTRIFGGSNNNSLFALPWLPRILTPLFSLVLIFWLIWLAWPGSKTVTTTRFNLSFSLAIVEMLLISPYAWLYYFPLLVIPLVVAWQASQRLRHGSVYKVLIAFSWLLSSIPTATLIAAEDIPKNQPAIWFFTTAGFHFYVLLFFAGILIVMLLNMDKPWQDKEI